MNTIFLDKIVSDNPTLDAAAILNVAVSDTRTVNKILGADLRVLFTSTGLGARLTRTAATLTGANQIYGDILSDFVAYVMSGTDFDSTDKNYSDKIQSLANLLIPANIESTGLYGLSANEVISIVTLGDGYRTFDATIDDVNASMARVQAANAFTTIRSLVDSAFNPAQTAYDAANALHNSRGQKLNTIEEAGGEAPADLASLDAAGGS